MYILCSLSFSSFFVMTAMKMKKARIQRFSFAEVIKICFGNGQQIELHFLKDKMNFVARRRPDVHTNMQ